MTATQRQLGVAATLVVTLLAALLLQPEAAVQEAVLSCPGSADRQFPNMLACSKEMMPGCSCIRPPNPLATLFTAAVPLTLGLIAAFGSIRGWAASAGLLAASIGLTGTGFTLVQRMRGRIDNVDVSYAVSGVIMLIVASLVVFTIARFAKNWWVRWRVR